MKIRFRHGLGDAVYFAHTLPLYAAAGHAIEVDCDPTHAPLFCAAGATMLPALADGCAYHDYPEPGQKRQTPGAALLEANKTAFNLGRPPMPRLDRAQAWRQLLEVRLRLDEQIDGPQPWLSDKRSYAREEVRDFVSRLPRPIVLLHAHGRPPVELRSLSADESRELQRQLLDRTDGSVILLDWTGDQAALDNFRIRNLARDWQPLSLLSLIALYESSDLLIGVDSGPLHLARFTDTPAIGLWTRHLPAYCSLPRAQTLNITTCGQHATNLRDRIAWRTVEASAVLPQVNGWGERVDLAFVADRAAEMLAGKTPAEIQIDQFVSWTRSGDGGGYLDRHRSFAHALGRLRTFQRPTIVETGCIRGEEDWRGAGYSTYLFAAWCLRHGARLISVDLSQEFCGFARRALEPIGLDGAQARVVQQNSLDFFRRAKDWGVEQIDLLYLDSLDTFCDGHEEHGLLEAQLGSPLVSPRGLILIDDTWTHKGTFRGKGARAVPWLLASGWQIVYAGYQVLLERAK